MVRRRGAMLPNYRGRSQPCLGTAIWLLRQLQRRMAEGDRGSQSHPPEASGVSRLGRAGFISPESIDPPQPEPDLVLAGQPLVQAPRQSQAAKVDRLDFRLSRSQRL